MPSFYDQDNPRGYVETKSNYANNARNVNNMRNSAPGYNSVRPLAEQEAARRCVQNSMRPGSAKAMEQRLIKQQLRRRERNRRIATLGLTCLVVGGVLTMSFDKIAHEFGEQATIYESIVDFSKDVIYPNMHRTSDDQYYYYDYEDIAEYLMMPGKDFSTELYKAYTNMGAEQVSRVLSCTGSGYSSIDDFINKNGYEGIREWEKSEREKILLQEQINDKQAELAQMQAEQNETTTAIAMDAYQGGNK